MYLFRDFCYSTITQLRDYIKSDLSGNIAGFTVNNQFVLVNDVFDVGSNQVVISIHSYNIVSGTWTDAGGTNVLVQLPNCSSPGYQKTTTNMNVTDAVTLGWLVVGVLVIAYATKLIRRTLI